ncbi:hypothetical protein B0H10DRAFT_2214556 [Mycena sp. CBHHK59/15]|nr:hypothetical protein B0H10DRAFT_2214556 [Mycena sp. CBHHK59/15]
MSYARPQLGDATVNPLRVKLEVPKGWYTTISSVSRRAYNQLVVVEYENKDEGLDPGVKSLVNTSNTPNGQMEDTDEGATRFSSCHHKASSYLAEANYASNKFQTHIITALYYSNDPNAPEGIPDYMTVLIFVEDAPDSAGVDGRPQFNNLVVTISVVYVLPVTPAPPMEIGTKGILEAGNQAANEFIARYIRPGKRYPGPPPPYDPTPDLTRLPVCIIGMGAAGLYIGMMLDTLNIKYEILEGSGRIGGRLYTHKFPQNPGKYQYFDVGAMCYPKSSFMKRTFNLVKERLKMPNVFIPYDRTNENMFLCYNDITATRAEDKNRSKADTKG